MASFKQLNGVIMANYSQIKEIVLNRIRSGFPDGVDETSRNQLTVLLQRIVELERALEPFATVGTRNNFGKELCNVYYGDCVKAGQVLDRAASRDIELLTNPKVNRIIHGEIPAEDF